MMLARASRSGWSSSTMAMEPVFEMSLRRCRLTIRGAQNYPPLGGGRYLLSGGGGFYLLRHADQVRERVRLCFLHDVGSMGFHRELAGSQFMRDLLVQQAGDHQ